MPRDRSSGDHPPRCSRSSVPADVAYLRSVLPSTTEDAFFDYLATLDASEVTLSAVPEGSVVFARVGCTQYPPLLWGYWLLCPRGGQGCHCPAVPTGPVPAGEGAAAGGAAAGDHVAVLGQLRQVGIRPAPVPQLPATAFVSAVPNPSSSVVVPSTSPHVSCGQAERVPESPPALGCVLAPCSA